VSRVILVGLLPVSPPGNDLRGSSRVTSAGQ